VLYHNPKDGQYFDANSKKAQSCWVDCSNNLPLSANDSETFESSGLSNILGPGPYEYAFITNLLGPGPYDAISVPEDKLPFFETHHAIVVICQQIGFEIYKEDRFEVGADANWWRGAAFMRKPSPLSNTYEDVTAGDYRIIIN
jgi:hypothetical protein